MEKTGTLSFFMLNDTQPLTYDLFAIRNSNNPPEQPFAGLLLMFSPEISHLIHWDAASTYSSTSKNFFDSTHIHVVYHGMVDCVKFTCRTDVYSELIQTSKMELFANIGNDF